ncbi:MULTISPECIES: hypothetical protein [unclassified Thermoactinomyces]|uniref:hypothetical protein n=1 Tax=unclassified Thermoactinomyces TaxID=2634588 RepID=UPI0018DC91B0|nr:MULTISPECIES: hypothetical protein [unclassified Thermoactinomyces]MBH8599715.1 hypothetical protein [Thermoactinomyces sp. CICC 10523]MBH8608580.1 hypothetical protein [Thermoactinomyces sp. CICC 10521]
MDLSIIKKIKTIINLLTFSFSIALIYFMFTDTTPPWFDYFLGSAFMLAAIRYGIDSFMEEKEKDKKSFFIVAIMFIIIAILILLVKPIKSGLI